MNRHTVIFATDKRQEYLGESLAGNKLSCRWEEYQRLQKNDVEEYIYILPVPVNKLDKIQDTKRKLKEELINKKCCGAKLQVFGGGFSEEWMIFLKEEGIPFVDFMQLPEVVEGNGWITAEGTLVEVLRYGSRSIWKQNVMVTGYGCCGEKIAKVFSWLGANVTVVARKKEVREQIEKEGFWAIDFSEMKDFAGDMDTVINTVPFQVITKEIIESMNPHGLIVDIASAPGGTDFEFAKERGINARLSLGLPGIYTPESSATLLRKAVERYTVFQENCREDRTWIYQIII